MTKPCCLADLTLLTLMLSLAPGLRADNAKGYQSELFEKTWFVDGDKFDGNKLSGQ